MHPLLSSGCFNVFKNIPVRLRIYFETSNFRHRSLYQFLYRSKLDILAVITSIVVSSHTCQHQLYLAKRWLESCKCFTGQNVCDESASAHLSILEGSEMLVDCTLNSASARYSPL